MDGEMLFDFWILCHFLLMAVHGFGTGTVNMVLGNAAGRLYSNAVLRFSLEVFCAEGFTFLLGLAAKKWIPFWDWVVYWELSFIAISFCICCLFRRSKIFMVRDGDSTQPAPLVEQDTGEQGRHPQ